MPSCQAIINSKLEDKNDFVKKKELCWNCDAKGHNIKDCSSNVRCHIHCFSKKHHTLFHDLPKFSNTFNQNNLNLENNQPTPSKDSIQCHILVIPYFTIFIFSAITPGNCKTRRHFY